jgi:hypothetical protein
MSQAIQLSDPALGAIVSISDDDWTTINQQIGIILAFRRGWRDTFDVQIPSFKALTYDCALWRNGTFPLIAGYPARLVRYADLVAQLLASLRPAIGRLEANEPLPEALGMLARNYFGVLGHGAAALSLVASAAAERIARFSGDNAVVEAAADRVMGHPIQHSMSRIELAAGKVTGAWQAMSDDLAQVMSGELPITTALLLSLDIDFTLASWVNVRNEATAFAAITPKQQQYLDDGWQTGLNAMAG